MQLMFLGFLFVVGLFIYYLASTSSSKFVAKKKPNVKKEGNVIFLQRDKDNNTLEDEPDETSAEDNDSRPSSQDSVDNVASFTGMRNDKNLNLNDDTDPKEDK